MLRDSGNRSWVRRGLRDRTNGEVLIRVDMSKQARTRCVIVGETSNDTTSRAQMRVSRKAVTSATHAIPEIHFEEQELTSFGGLVMLQALLRAEPA